MHAHFCFQARRMQSRAHSTATARPLTECCMILFFCKGQNFFNSPRLLTPKFCHNNAQILVTKTGQNICHKRQSKPASMHTYTHMHPCIHTHTCIHTYVRECTKLGGVCTTCGHYGVRGDVTDAIPLRGDVTDAIPLRGDVTDAIPLRVHMKRPRVHAVRLR